MAGVVIKLALVAGAAALVSKRLKKYKLKLWYFDIKGKGECIRLICAYTGQELEDYRFKTFDDFLAMKEKFAFGQVPMLEVDGKTQLVQTAAIMRFVGTITGLHPRCPLQAALVDAVVNAEDDLFAGLSVVSYPERSGFKCLSETDLDGVRKSLNDDVLPRHLANLEKQASLSTTGWIAGTARPSIADFILIPRLQAIQNGSYVGIAPTIMDSCPHLTSMIDKMMALPQIKAYYNPPKSCCCSSS